MMPISFPSINTAKQLWEHTNFATSHDVTSPCHKSTEKMLSDEPHIVFQCHITKNIAKQLWEFATHLPKKGMPTCFALFALFGLWLWATLSKKGNYFLVPRL
jgi:hypothetical protein